MQECTVRENCFDVQQATPRQGNDFGENWRSKDEQEQELWEGEHNGKSVAEEKLRLLCYKVWQWQELADIWQGQRKGQRLLGFCMQISSFDQLLRFYGEASLFVHLDTHCRGSTIQKWFLCCLSMPEQSICCLLGFESAL